MVVLRNRILIPCIPLFFLLSCSGDSLQQPDLIGARYQVASGSSAPTTKLELLDYYSTDPISLPSVTIDGSVTSTQKIFLGFSQFLNGSLIESVTRNAQTGQIETIKPIPDAGIVEVWTCPTAKGCTVSANYSQIDKSQFIVSYRPDGGYIPKSDTPVSSFPPPAVAVTWATSLPATSVVAVHVIANKLSNTDGVKMAQITDSNGKPVVTPGGSPVAGTVWFQTK